MKKPVQWESVINDKHYVFSYGKVKGKHVITANGNPITVKAGFISWCLGLDEKFMLEDIEARLVMDRNTPDVAVNGVYLRSGKKYIQRPAWVVVFSILCVVIPIISVGGMLPVFLGLAGISLNVSASKTSLPLAARLALCIVITGLAWLCWFLV